MTTVLVTGASGYIAKHIVRELLDSGYSVRAGIRSDTAHHQLITLFGNNRLEFARIDLVKDEGWREAMDGVDALLHTASPFPKGDPQDPNELILPAHDGTLRALQAAQQAGVQRTVLTSSCAAIYKDPLRNPRLSSTRDNWTDPHGPSTSSYEMSKTYAERTAWDFVDRHPEMRLTTINPGLVLGPPMDHHYGTSLEHLERFLSGKDPALPRIMAPIVDVRDVARMHVRAIDNPATVGLRFPACAGELTLPEIAALLHEHYPSMRFATAVIPDWVMRALGRLFPSLRQASLVVGMNLAVDGHDGPEVMGFSYIPPKQTILDTAEWLLAHRHGS